VGASEELVRRWKGAVSTIEPSAGVAQGLKISPKGKSVVVRRSSLDDMFDVLRLCETGNNFRGAVLFHRKSSNGQLGFFISVNFQPSWST
jgi:hypothetical protein